MKAIAVSLALGALALCGVPSAQASSSQTRAPAVGEAGTIVQDTDMSSHRRHWRRYHRHVHYPRYYRSYGYYPQPYYRPAPVVRFGFGFGGPRYHRHWHHW
jgi:hypothetical protein